MGLAVVGGLNRRLERRRERRQLDESNDEAGRALAETEDSGRRRRGSANVAVAVNDFLQKDLLGQADIGNQPFLGEKAEREPEHHGGGAAGPGGEGDRGEVPGPAGDGGGHPADDRRRLPGAGQVRAGLAAPGAVGGAVRAEAGGRPPRHADQQEQPGACCTMTRAKYDKAEPLFLEVLAAAGEEAGRRPPRHPDQQEQPGGAVPGPGEVRQGRAALPGGARDSSEKKLGADHPDTLRDAGQPGRELPRLRPARPTPSAALKTPSPGPANVKAACPPTWPGRRGPGHDLRSGEAVRDGRAVLPPGAGAIPQSVRQRRPTHRRSHGSAWYEPASAEEACRCREAVSRLPPLPRGPARRHGPHSTPSRFSARRCWARRSTPTPSRCFSGATTA